MQSRGSGVLHWVYEPEGGPDPVGYVATVEHVIAPVWSGVDATITVRVATPDGERDVQGWVVEWPTVRGFGEQLAAVGAVESAGLGMHRVVEQGMDVAFIRLAGPGLAGVRFDPLVFESAAHNAPAGVLGYPGTVIPVVEESGQVVQLATAAEHLVVTVGRVAEHPELEVLDGMVVGGNPWPTPGNSGGAVGPLDDGSGPDVLYGLVVAVGRVPRWPGTGQVVEGVDGPVVNAFARASRVGPGFVPPALELAEFDRLDGQLVRALLGRGTPAATADQLARAVGVLPRDGRRFAVPGSSAVVGASPVADVVLDGAPAAAEVEGTLAHRVDGWHVVGVDRAGPVLDGGPLLIEVVQPGETRRVRPHEDFPLGADRYRLETPGGWFAPRPRAPPADRVPAPADHRPPGHPGPHPLGLLGGPPDAAGREARVLELGTA